MIYFYSGTPGSGKSLHTAKNIVRFLRSGKNIILCNMQVDYDYIKSISKNKELGKIINLEYEKLTTEFLINYALDNHIEGEEGQTLIVMDEAQVKFSPNAVKLACQEDKQFRQNWLNFATQHRHLGYTIIIISQFDRLIDAQLRCLFEYNVIHRKANNYSIGRLLSIFNISLFVSIDYWYGVNLKTDQNFFFYSKKYSKIYNSYKHFAEMKFKRGEEIEKEKEKNNINFNIDINSNSTDFNDIAS